MGTLLLVRHGETDWNRSGQIMGSRPIPLNRNGEAQANHLAEFLKRRSHNSADPGGPNPPHAAFPRLIPGNTFLLSSPVRRAMQTAEALSHGLGIPLQAESGLSEIGVGEWEGRFWNEIGDHPVRRRYYSDPTEARPPGGETFAEVQARAVAVIHRIHTQPPASVLILVSHADVIRALVAHYLSLSPHQTHPMRIDHTSMTGLALSADPASLLFLNFVPVELAAEGGPLPR